jgi:hypothetical protein
MELDFSQKDQPVFLRPEKYIYKLFFAISNDPITKISIQYVEMIILISNKAMSRKASSHITHFSVLNQELHIQRT